ncbi:hypothetical protein CHUAL_008775 [Chamberlinius hualienensis]
MISRSLTIITIALCLQLVCSDEQGENLLNGILWNEKNWRVEVKCSSYQLIDVALKLQGYLINKIQVEEMCSAKDNNVFPHPQYPLVYQLVENHLLQAIIDLMDLWKRRNGLFIIDDSSGIDTERDKKYFERSNIQMTFIRENETILNNIQNLNKISENIIIVCNEETTEKILNKEKDVDIKQDTNNTILLTLSTDEQMALSKKKLNEVIIYDVFYGHYRHKNEMVQFAKWTPVYGIREVEFLDEKLRVQRLRGKSIRTSVFEHPPYSYLNYSSGKLVVTGYVADIYNMVMDTLNMRYTPHESPYGFGMGINGTYTGAVGIMYRKEAEMTMNVLAHTLSRLPAIRYAGQMSQAFLVIGYIRPKPYVPPTAYWLPFQVDVWITTLVALIVLIIAIGIGVIFSPSSYSDPTPSVLVHTRLYRVITGTFFDEALEYPAGFSSKIFYGVLLVSTMMVFSYYTSVFTAFLAMLEMKIPFNDMEDVLRTKDFRVLYVKTALHHDRFRSAKDGLYARVWKKLEAVGDGIANFDMLLWTFYQGKHVYLADGPSTFAVTYDNCTASFASITYMYDILNMATRNDFPYVKLINNILLKMRESGIMDYLTTVYHMRRPSPCAVEQSSEQLGLEQAVGIYILFATGIGIALLSLSIEIIIARKSKTNHINRCMKSES